ncbi:hypothetical protein Tco_1414746 [Tanacetum coccineum]
MSLPDDPYMAVRQAYLATIMDSESGPFEVGQAYTPAAIDTKSEPEEAPLETEEFRPLAARTAPPSLDHTPISSDSTPVSPLTNEEFEATRPYAFLTVHTQPAMSPGLLARVIEAMTLSPLTFRKRYRSSYEMPSPSSCPTLPIRKRYRGTSELVEDTRDESSYANTEREGSGDESPSSKDEGPGLEDEGPGLEEEAAPKGQQQLALEEGSMPSTFNIGQSFRSMSGQQRVEETPTPKPPVHAIWVDLIDGIVYTDILIYVPPVPTIALDEDEFLEVGAQLELHGIILHDHTQRLDALPPALFEVYDRDLRELYTRSRAIRDEIFSPCYRLRSLE